MNEPNEPTKPEATAILPLWRNCLEKMRAEGLSFGSNWVASFFELELRCPRESNEFQFAMLNLGQAIQSEDEYYFRSSESGALYDIPSAEEHIKITAAMEASSRRKLVRSISLRSGVLSNPAASLSDANRKILESDLERASLRLLLISKSAAMKELLDKQNIKRLNPPPQPPDAP